MLLRFFRLSGLKVAVAATLVVVLTYYFDPDFLSLLELKAQPVIIYELLAGTPGQEKLAREFESALTEYDRGRWDEALVRFQSLVDSYPQDGPAGMYVERCRFLKENPPPGKWDGIFRSEQMKG